MRKYILPLAILVFLCAALYGAHRIYEYFYAPMRATGQEKIITIRSGWHFDRISQYLREQGIIQSPFRFKLMARLMGASSSIKAGEYRIDTSWSRTMLLSHLIKGDVLLHKLQIPAGLTWWDTARIVDDSGLASFSDFADQVHNAELLEKYGIPGSTAEGFLYPETYYFAKDKERKARRIVERMLRQFRETTDKRLWKEQRPDGERLAQMVTLASLVEKETAHPEERKTVAGVFANRLQQGMRLQCDPTVIYGLGPGFDGNLTKKHLRDPENPYNTYAHAGLPPGPICSPGLAALQAAQDPEDHSYLYFVSQGDGNHHFSRSLREHNRAVRRYQLR